MSDREQTIFGGRYELHRRLARGGMADVFLARDQLLDRPVAIKVLFSEFAGDPSFVERFRREAQSAANLNHPNIVSVYDWGEEDGTYFIVMEYVEGRSLAEILRTEGALLPERAADITIDVAAALGFAHRNGVIHRDIKPGNILISPTGQVKVTDFGIARAMAAGAEENLTQTGAVMGTATYFSPEQAQGKAVDPRSDVYSLGVVLYEMIAGRAPFTGDSPVAIAYKHVQESPTPLSEVTPSIHPAMEAIVAKAMAKSVENRYPSAEDLRSDLRRYREGHRILAEPPADATVAVAAAAAGATTINPVYEGTQVVEAAYADEDYEEARPRGVFIVVLILLLLILTGLLFVLAQVLGLGKNDEPTVKQIEVPDVVNDKVDDAQRALQAKGFKVTLIFEETDQAEANIVFAQDPAGGSQADEGSRVRLRVAKGARLVKMPSLIGRSEEDARQALIEAGFTGEVTTDTDFSDTVAKNNIIEQTPAANTNVPLNAPITLLVSDGPEQRQVPLVAGKSFAEADAALTEAGFKVSRSDEFSSSVPADDVIGTSPPAGTMLPKNSVITVKVSKGVEMVTVPSVKGLSEANARKQLETAGFQVEVTEQSLPPGDPDDGQVISQSPEGGQTAPKGSTVSIVVGHAVIGSSDSSSSN